MTLKTFLKQHCSNARLGCKAATDMDSAGQSEAARRLQEAIIAALEQIPFPQGLGVVTASIVRGIQRDLDAAAFDQHNRGLGVVEARAKFTATTHEGCPVFNLVIIWDADVISQISHYGWEVYLEDVRVAGPGHVVFRSGCTLKHFRKPGYEEVEEKSLRLRKCTALGTGRMLSQVNYYRLAK